MAKLNLQVPEIAGLQVSFNPATGSVADALQVRSSFSSDDVEKSGVLSILQRLQAQQAATEKAMLERGRLDAEAGTDRSSTMQPWELQGYRIGQQYQKGLQGLQVELTQHSKQYMQRTLEGADTAEKLGIYQSAVAGMQQRVQELDLPDIYKQQLRKEALDNLEVLVKAQANAEKVHTERQYNQGTVTVAASLRNALQAAASANDPAAASTAIRNAFNSQVALAFSVGNDKEANKEASGRIVQVLDTLIQNFDPQDPQQVAARNLLLQTANSALGDVLDVQDISKLQDLLHKADERVRDFNGVQAAMQVEQMRRDILGGKWQSPEQLQAQIDATVAAARAGQLSPSDALQRVRSIGDLQELQMRQQAAGSSSTDDTAALAGMTLAEALAKYGSESKWVTANVKDAIARSNGDTVAAGAILFEQGRINRSDEMTSKGIELFTKDISYTLNNFDPEAFEKATGNVTSSKAFDVWKRSFYEATEQGRQDLQEQLTKALGSNSAAVVQILQQNPSADLATVIRGVQQWKQVGGFERQKQIHDAAEKLTAEQFLPERRYTNALTIGTSPHSWDPLAGVHWSRSNPDTNMVAQLYLANARSILRKKAGSMAMQNVMATGSESALAALQGSGNALSNEVGAFVLDDAVKQKLLNTGMQKGDTAVAKLIQDYQVQFGQGKPQNVFVDGTWDSDKLRFVIIEDGKQIERFVSYRDIGAKYIKDRAALQRREQQAQQVRTGGVPWAGVPSLNLRTKELQGLLNKPKPRTVAPAAPAKPKRQTALSSGVAAQRQISPRNQRLTNADISAMLKASTVKNQQRAERLGINASTPSKPAAPAAPASTPARTPARTSGAMSRVQILQSEIAAEQRALQAAEKRGDKAAVDDIRKNIAAITRELQRSR